MAASRSSARPSGKHEWNSYENYRDLHERYLSSHPIIESHTVGVAPFDYQGHTFVVVAGEVRCRNGVVLEVEKYAEAERRARSRLFVRTYSYRYNAYVPGKCTVLRYDNGHGDDFEEYHAHTYDPKTGEATKVGKRITRDEMPHLSGVLDEIQALPL